MFSPRLVSRFNPSAPSWPGTRERPVMLQFHVRWPFQWVHPLLALLAFLTPFVPLLSQAAAPPITDPESAELREEFANAPTSHGWEYFGNPELFQWNALQQNLEVTWDSSQPNSYLRLPLGTLLTRHDSFSLELDLQLNDIEAGISDLKPGTFQIAFGFQSKADADRPQFIRGTGDRSPNLVEFNFFPDTGYGPTVWPAIFAENGRMNYSGSGDFSLFELPVKVPLHIRLSFDAGTQSAHIQVQSNGSTLGTATAVLSRAFTWFELDSLCLASYSDAGQAPFMPGSILAHGTVDNLVARIPPSPIRSEQIKVTSGRWTHTLLSRTGWNYTLQSSPDLESWTDFGPTLPGTGETLSLETTTAASDPQRFFRIKAAPIR